MSDSRTRGLPPVMYACVVLVVGMVAAINLAVPMLAASPLHPSPSALIWIVDAYVVVFACLVIPGGAAGDRFGREGVLLAGLLLFAAGSAVSALAPGAGVLLAGRAATGIGAAAVLPNTLAILLHAVPAERRGGTIATWASMTGIGGVIGNVGGGLALSAAQRLPRPDDGVLRHVRAVLPQRVFLQYVLGFGVLRTGLGILPLTVPLILGSRHVGRLSGRIGVNAAHPQSTAFVSGADDGLRVVGVAVLVLGALVLLQSRRGRPPVRTSIGNEPEFRH